MTAPIGQINIEAERPHILIKRRGRMSHAYHSPSPASLTRLRRALQHRLFRGQLEQIHSNNFPLTLTYARPLDYRKETNQ